MAFTASKFNNIEAAYLQIAKRDSNGYPMGTLAAPDSPVANTVYSAYPVDGLIDFNPGTITRPVVTNQGGQKVIGKTRLSARDFGTPTFTLSQRDETLDALISKTSLDLATNTTRAIRAMNASQRLWDRYIVILSILTTNSNTGADEFDHYVYLNCEIEKTQDAGAGQVTGDVTNPNPLTYQLSLSLSSRDASGELISGLATAPVGNQDAGAFYRTANPLHLATYIKNGSATTFTLPYLPLSAAVTVNASSNHMTINGVVTAATSASITTGAVEVAAGTTGEITVMTYETNFVTV
jgi:hypothetical protein